MSALGHKQTYAVQNAMSALPPIATAKADIRSRSCLLYPRKRTCAVHKRMSAMGQTPTSRELPPKLLINLRGTAKPGRGHRRPSRFARFKIDYHLVLGGRRDRQAGRLPPFKKAVDIAGPLPVLVEQIGTVGD